MSLEKDFAYLQIPLEEVVSATDNFSDENFIRQDGFRMIYKGKLSKSGKSIDIVARRLDPKYWLRNKEFWTEILMLSSLKHTNLVSVVGYCDEEGEMIIIYKYEENGSLDKYLNDPITLTWTQRLRICVGVVRALSYMYYDEGRDFSVVHRNINSSQILLDDKWEPKLSGFELSIKNARDRKHRLILAHVSGIYGYMDPIYVKTGCLSHKSDVFSLGVVLFEVLCGRRAFIPVPDMHSKEGTADDPDLKGHPWFDNIAAQMGQASSAETESFSEGLAKSGFQVPKFSGIKTRLEDLQMPDEGAYLFQLAKSHYEEGKLDDMIHPGLRKQMDSQSLQIFSEAAYCCLKDQRAQRPDIHQVAAALDKALELQSMHEKPEHSVAAVEATTNRWKGKNLDHLKIGLHDIELATDNFSNSYCIGSGGYGMVYKAELEHFDNKNSSEIEERNKCELPKVCSTVAIKRIFKREDAQGEQGFIVEVETLSTCKHPNIVSLLGFCDEGPQMILVYELAANGSLEDYLGSTSKITNFIPWVQRLKICIDVAHGLNYLHTSLEDKQKIIHRDIKSANILLNENWEAMIADFGLSRLGNQLESTLNTNILVGTKVYWDPEYQKTGRLKKASDIYSFGVVLFEILSGSLAYDRIYMEDNDKGIAPIARRRFKEKTLNEMIDPKLKEETDVENVLSRGLNQDSFETFSKIAYQCLAEIQAQRPTVEVVIKELKKALYFQENHKDNLQISLDDIKLMTQNFSDDSVIGRGGFGIVYKGEVTSVNGRTEIAAKRLDRIIGDIDFLTEIKILSEYKHENVIGILGYCNEKDERIIINEYMSKGILSYWLNHDGLKWIKRLEVCIDIASGLEFLHGTSVEKQEVVIHRDIKSENILLNRNGKAKITNFGISLVISTSKEMDDYIIDSVIGTPGYVDPLYASMGFLTKESDMYSFGVVLLEILCGIRVDNYERIFQTDKDLVLSFKRQHEEGEVSEMVFEGIKQQIVPQSLATFSNLAYHCLHDMKENRPPAKDLLLQLRKALEFQVDYDTWEPKLPKDYKEIIQMSESPEIYSTKKKEDLYNILLDGILLQQGKVFLSFNGNGDKNTMISATTFSYRNRCPHKWRRSLPESRFHKVVEMLDISNLTIKIKTRTQFLSPDTIYGVHLVFKFCDSRDISSKPMHVNYLKYRKGREPLHAYFATWRDKEWMMIELYRFLNQNEEDVIFKFLIESLSTINNGDDAIYVEGIEFRAIDKASLVEHEEVKKLNEVGHVVKSNSNVDQVQQSPTKNDEQLLLLSEVNGKKHIMLSAKAALRNFTDKKLFKSKLYAESRFEEVTELLPHQVFRINCTIKSQMLSGDTEYECYLVFKLSEECQGLHCPVEVRDLLHRENNEAAIIYFVAPSPWNVHDITRVPKQREDGWMEVNVWKFNSNHGVKNDCIPVNLKFISYEGTMSGLILCGLEFRPM